MSGMYANNRPSFAACKTQITCSGDRPANAAAAVRSPTFLLIDGIPCHKHSSLSLRGRGPDGRQGLRRARPLLWCVPRSLPVFDLPGTYVKFLSTVNVVLLVVEVGM